MSSSWQWDSKGLTSVKPLSGLCHHIVATWKGCIIVVIQPNCPFHFPFILSFYLIEGLQWHSLIPCSCPLSSCPALWPRALLQSTSAFV